METLAHVHAITDGRRSRPTVLPNWSLASYPGHYAECRKGL